MIVKNQFLSKLKEDLKINIYEAKIWTALLSRGISTAAELSDISGVPRSRCYDVLESLEKKGFIMMKVGRPIKYIAIQPEEVIFRLKKEAMQEEQRLLNGFDNVKASNLFKELELLHSSGIACVKAEDLSDYIIGRSEITRKIKDMIANAQTSITIYTSPDGYERKSKLLRNYMPKLKKKKVKVFINAPVKDNKLTDVKFSNKELNTRFVLIDGKEILFTITNDSVLPAYDAAVHVKSPFFAKAVEQMVGNL